MVSIDSRGVSSRINNLSTIVYVLTHKWLNPQKWINKGMQLHVREVLLIARMIEQLAPCNLLVFGIGHDARLWMRFNSKGRTTFLEDDEQWLKRIKERNPWLEAHRVRYSTRLSEWHDYLTRPEQLAMSLPDAVRNTQWDVIVVDGPAGYADYFKRSGVEAPGRMQSIYMASRLIRPGGSVFVHDCERPIENAYTDRFLLQTNLVAEVSGRALLRHYVFPVSDASLAGTRRC